ncbi:flavodoxin [Oceanobacillus polygoni]|uniref:Ribonucleotide reductase-associated flavodoxin n=1 Tax=Oceanobacillus polygoni TaxID=1235259 RepID=A0A9X1CAX8_9BACI|nr:flavodoxin [Oceanobacillus polygoni]MBP2076346.1 putative ribonucleotide reductase-associated flavodoxin [Oceanobacillus polygoni]
MRAIIAYLSYSGNTEEVAELIENKLKQDGISVDMHRIGIDAPFDPKSYDFVFLGTFTWEMGSTPDEVKDLILEIGYKPDNIAVFGTGDTQFGGDDLFCKAVDKLVKFYDSKWTALKIEQSPRGSQEEKVELWLEGVLHHAKSFA